MKNKSHIVIVALIMALASVITAAAFTLPEQDSTVQPVAEETAADYYLRDCDGYIAVYRGSSSTPLDITDIETATLNDTDINLLRSGIPAHSRNELLMLLEDLGS